MMNSLSPIWLSYPESFEESAFLAGLQSLFAFDEEREHRFSSFIFDTFDWRIYRKGLRLLYQDGCLELSREGEPLASLSIRFAQQPFFARDLPASELRDRLESLASVRALLPWAGLAIRERLLPILDRNEKMVARVVLQEIRRAGRGRSEAHKLVKIEPLRGYETEAQRLMEYFKAGGFGDSQRDVFEAALEISGVTPGGYNNKLRVQLQADERSDQALSKILRFQLGVMIANQEGIIKDIDSEFLHDFRVAVRRSRSALSLFKQVFAPDSIAPFGKALRELGKQTNLLRDLDVYLLRQTEFQQRVPLDFQKGLNPLFQRLRRDRERAHSEVIRLLTSVSYQQFTTSWRSFLEQTPEERAYSRDGHKPVKKLADKQIYRKYQQIVKAGEGIGRDAEDQQLHRLRIECKKLRYLLEFFYSLYPGEEVDQIIRQLKRLQDNLGLFNDLCMQIEHLSEYGMGLKPGKRLGNLAILAVGSLIGSLYTEKQQCRKKFSGLFEEFRAPENWRQFERLFRRKKEN